MRHQIGTGENVGKIVLSLCDFSAQWPMPYADAGYSCFLADIKYGDDCRNPQDILRRFAAAILEVPEPREIRGILCATPCTAFSVSGAQWWPRHDADGTTANMTAIADGCLDIIEALHPKWWALENPVGRIERCVPRLQGRRVFTFNPCDYAGYASDPVTDAYNKKTIIWGEGITKPQPKPIAPEILTFDGGNIKGSWMIRLGGKSERTKTLRSLTPQGFAIAFAKANP